MKKILLVILSLFLVFTVYTQPLSGTYTIGQAPGGNYDFNSFTSAINTLKANGHAGVTFLVDTGTYNEQLNIVDITGNGRITFQSMNGDSSSVIVQSTFSSNSDHLVYIDSLSSICFHQLSFIAFNSSGVNGEKMIYSYLNVDTFIISNCKITGGLKGMNQFENVNSIANYNIVINNKIENGKCGVRCWEGILHNNQIIDFKHCGVMRCSAKITNNLIKTSIDSVYNIALDLFTAPEVVVKNNTIIDVNIGISIWDNFFNDIQNNFFSINRPGFKNIILRSGYLGGIANFSHNTVNMLSGDSNSTVFQEFDYTFNITNNIFKIDTGHFLVTNTHNFSSEVKDFNVFDINTTSIFMIDTFSNIICADLQAYQATGKCTSCLSATPSFVSNTDLHLSNTQFLGSGTSYVPKYYWYTKSIDTAYTDIDGEPRDLTLVTPGADVIPGNGVDLEVYQLLLKSDTLDLYYQDTLIVSIYQCGSQIASSFDLQLDSNGTTYQTLNNISWSPPITHVKIPNFQCPKNDFKITAKVINNQDINPINDTLTKKFWVVYRDLEIGEISSPSDTIYAFSSPISVWIKNKGNLAIDTCVLMAQSQLTDSVFTNIQPGDSFLYTFNSNYVFLPSDTNICITGTLDKDINQYNNSNCKSIHNTTGISEIQATNALTIYPNPASEKVYFNSSMPILSVQVYTNQGIWIKTITFTETQNFLNVADLSQGLYQLRLFSEGQVLGVKKLVILK
jgi:hypothetical protein